MQMQIVEVTRLQPEVVAIVEIEEVTVQSMTDAFHEWASNDTELHGAMYDLLVVTDGLEVRVGTILYQVKYQHDYDAFHDKC
jgi:hypothetical protein